MNKALIADDRRQCERALTEYYLEKLNEDSFARLFKVLTPQLVAFFRARRCDQSLAEDLAQEVMLTVHRKATQIRDRKVFRAWLFRVAHNALCRHFENQARQVATVDLDGLNDGSLADGHNGGRNTCFEFHRWMTFLDTREREVMTLRFIEQWEYHEIAAAQAIPIGTVQWRVFNAKKKLAPHLAARHEITRKAA